MQLPYIAAVSAVSVVHEGIVSANHARIRSFRANVCAA